MGLAVKAIDFRFRPPTPEFTQMMHGLVGEAFGWSDRQLAGWRPAIEHPVEVQPGDSTDLTSCVRWMEEAEVVGVVLGRDIPGSRVPNSHIKELVDRYPGRFLPFGGVDPSPGNRKQCMEATEQIAREYGFLGIQFDPGRLAVPMYADDARLYPLYALCEDLGIVVALQMGAHAGPDIRHSSPEPVCSVARDFPQLRIVLGHGCYPFVLETISSLFKHENIWVCPDSYHFFPGGHLYRDWANSSPLVAERILYGCAYLWPQTPAILDQFNRHGWNEDILDRVLFGNAAALLGVSGQ